MSAEYKILIEDGHVKFVYDDVLGDLMDEGVTAVCRVSHVEPHPTRNGWLADMRPVDGPVLGAQGEWSLVGVTTADTLAIVSEDEARAIEADIIEAMEPFKTRSEALAAEREWLSVNRGL